MSQGADPIRVLAGILLLLFGVVLVLAGGLCSFMMVGALAGGGDQFLMISLVVLALGLLSIYAGWHCMRPPRDR